MPEVDPRTRPVRVVLVTDDPDTTSALESVVAARGADVSASVVADAEAALEAVPSIGEEERFRPAPVVLLDVAASPDEALATLRAFKADEAHARAPVIALAADPDGDLDLYHDHANAVVERPAGTDERAERIGRVLDFWLQVPELP